MAGLHFGKSRWDEIPSVLGLTVDSGGVMSGLWQGMSVNAYFSSRHDKYGTMLHRTDVGMPFDPPLGVQVLESAELWTELVDPRLSADFEASAKGLGMFAASIGDGGIRGSWGHYEAAPERYRAAFELFAWAAQIILARRANNPPPWEIEIAQSWPALAQGWGLTLDVRRGMMTGTVGGRPMQVCLGDYEGAFTTIVAIAVPVPAGCELSLARQDGDGFFAKLFRGQDVVLGDPAFDAAFVVRGAPESFVRAALTPAARAHILELTRTGCAITLKEGALVAWAKERITDGERVDALMQAALAASLALCPEATSGAVPLR
ncbi:MAG: hypothetical protein V4850_03735 [Myxococcota bacterium]